MIGYLDINTDAIIQYEKTTLNRTVVTTKKLAPSPLIWGGGEFRLKNSSR
jgi:hypothetical protein